MIECNLKWMLCAMWQIIGRPVSKNEGNELSDTHGNSGKALIANQSLQMLIECEKLIEGEIRTFRAPLPGNKLEIKLRAPVVPREKFVLGLHEGARSSSMILSVEPGRKISMQTRDSTIPLVRVDIDERAKHTNPDGAIVTGSHVHVASWEQGMGIAYPLGCEEAIMVAGVGLEVASIFDAFCCFCHVEEGLNLQWTIGF